MPHTLHPSPPDLILFLGKTLLFRGLPESQLLELANLAIVQTYDKGESLFQQGDPATGFFIVQLGRIKVFKVAQDGREQILHIFAETHHFAEVPAWDGHPYPAAAAALEPATVLFFPRQPFLQLLTQQPDLAINLLKSFARHLRHFSNLVDTLTLHEVPTRLANYLLHLREQQGAAELIKLDLSKGQLAARLGTIPETLSRVLGKLKQQKLVVVNGSQIELLDLEGLKQLADMDNS